MPTLVAPLCLADSLAAGDQWVIEVSLPDYSEADGWTADLFLRGLSVLDVTGVGVGTDWTFTADAADTAPLLAGTYIAGIRVTNGSQRFTLSALPITVTPDLATAAAGSLLTHAERALPLVEAALERRVAVDLKSYTITNRSATKEEIADLERLRAKYRTEILKQRNGGRLPSVAVRFGRAG